MNLEEKQKRMDAIRRRRDAAAGNWTVTADATGTFVEASEGPDSERVYRIEDTANMDNRNFALCAPEDLIFVFEQFEALSRRIRGSRPDGQKASSARPPPDPAQECGRMCNDRAFRVYLSTCHDIDVADLERIEVGVRGLLQVKSRTELKSDHAAAERWRDLVAKFQLWLKGF